MIKDQRISPLVRAIFVWPWNDTRERNRKPKRKEIERFDWFIERIQTRVAYGWLSKHSGEKTSCPKNFLEINRYLALALYCNTIGQSNNAFSVLGCSLTGNEEAMLWSFHPWADKTNNEHLPKPFFKVIGHIIFCWEKIDVGHSWDIGLIHLLPGLL